MAVDLVMPKLGLTMTEGMIQQWVIAPGTAFEIGQVLAVVETEKIANEVEASADGVLESVLVPAGSTVPCGTPIATWIPLAPADAGRKLSTPYARKLARGLGVDLTLLQGTGPRGRIKAQDVQAAHERQAAKPDAVPVAPSVGIPIMGTRRPATPFERAAAERLTLAKRTPHFYLSTEADVGELERLRGHLNRLTERSQVSVTHFLLAALARTWTDLPQANRVWEHDEIVSFGAVDLGLAVLTERGLLAPVLRDVGGARLHDIAGQARALVERARLNQLTPDDFGPCATSLSNAGMHDVTHMTSIIAPGHSSIFGIGSVREVFRPDAKGRPRLKRELGLVMSADHRVFDGVSALTVLNRFKFYLENPLGLVV